MKYTYATLLLHETGAEINEQNITNVLESAKADEITTSRIKAMVAALEDVDISEYAAAGTPASVDETPEDTAADAANGEQEAAGEDEIGLVFGEDDEETEAGANDGSEDDEETEAGANDGSEDDEEGQRGDQ